MAQCPNCSKPIAVTEDHFGTLYRCEHCKTEFFIGFDGAPENSKEPLPSDLVVEEPAEPLVSSTNSLDLNVTPPDNAPAVSLSDMLGAPDDQGNQNQPMSDLFNIQTPSYEQPEQQYEPSQPSAEPIVEIPPERPVSNAFKDFTDDVQNFGNGISEAGILSFDIEISGIDLGETKRDLIEALDDKRFGWNLDEVTESIKDGKLTLTNVSAPKIIVLVKRITPIGLSLNWRHHVSTQ
ncbi:MAG: hypothetical protein JNM24_15570 [Bdellovibrionaceae bacterium]|jgi:DNA-directed RNA polymerase subunit RPC12/RpoP|nr:hypothetical protein [Pseudobdellovibrionaceae bacterium]